MPKLLQITAIDPDAQARLAASCNLMQVDLAAINASWLATRAAEVNGVVTGGHRGVPSTLMAALPNHKVISINSIGFDKVDLELARSRGVRVTNTPEVLTAIDGLDAFFAGKPVPSPVI